jgi:hypothetical protein
MPGKPMNQLSRCDRLIQIRAPEFLIKALDNAADKRLTSRSDYIRTVLLDRLHFPLLLQFPSLLFLGAGNLPA